MKPRQQARMPRVTEEERFYLNDEDKWRCATCGSLDVVDQGLPELGPVGLRCMAPGCGEEDIRPFTPEEREGLSEAGEDAPEDWLD